VPRLLSELKTHPGGHRGLRRFDPRILGLWHVLVNRADQETFEVELNMTQLAKTFGVARSTMQRWLAFFERHHLLKLSQRHGGRGRGLTVCMTWLKKGAQLALRRQKALGYKREQMRGKAETVAQRQTTFTSLRDDKNRAQLMGQLRTALASRVKDSTTACQVTQAFGKWVWNASTTVNRVITVLKSLQAADTVSIPRWARTVQDIHRWARSLIQKLLRYGATWWDLLQEKVERKRLTHILERIETAVGAGRQCPVCEQMHDRADWREGRNADGQLNCAGWARLKIEELRERKPPSTPPDRRTTSSMACWTCGRRVERLHEGRCRSCYRCARADKGQQARRVGKPQLDTLKARLEDLERGRCEVLRLHDTATLRLAWDDLIAQCQAEIMAVSPTRRRVTDAFAV